MNNPSRMHARRSASHLTFITTAIAAAALGTLNSAADWKDNAISPVTNPIFFEDPQVNSEVRPIFAYHNIDDDFVTQGGNAQLYAVQLRWAITDRLAVIATKDGWIDLNPSAGVDKSDGWADLAGGLKYALIDDREAEFILTPGLTFEFPTGQSDVLQGNGDGTWNPFISIGKGFGNLRFLANVGGIIPNNWAEETAQLHYSAQVDYTTCQYFIPFAAINAFTVVSEGTAVPLDVEGFDLFNFGSSEAEGLTQAVVGVGFRSRLARSFDIGFGYEFPITTPHGIFGDRYTVDMIWRF